MSRFLTRPAERADLPAIVSIYNHYIETSIATFEERRIDADELFKRWCAVADSGQPWLVIEGDGAIHGYAYATRWKPRSAYRYSAESTIYMGPNSVGKGLGVVLYRALQEVLGANGCHSVLAGIALPNEGSIRLHERLGFHKVGHLQQVGFKFGRWIDVGYWQRVFDSLTMR